MHIGSGRITLLAAMSIAVRSGHGFFLLPTLATVQRVGGGHVHSNVRCRMSSGVVPARVNVATGPIVEADTVERKVERLWGLGNADRPTVSDLPDMGLAREVAARLREPQKSEIQDDFVEEAEMSALRRYQYSGLEDDFGDDDDREYYI